MDASSSSSGFVKAHLFRGPLYREDQALWDTLRAQREEIRHYFRQIGQELVVDEGEGFAFIRQLEPEGDEPLPRLVQRRSLSYQATLLLVCLREELLRFEGAADDSTRLVRSRAELRALVSAFIPESNNQVRDVKVIDTAIARLEEYGFLRAMTAEREAFEVMRVLKARIGVTELEEIKQRLEKHARSAD
jgi:uncharacterized protein DUF4194